MQTYLVKLTKNGHLSNVDVCQNFYRASALPQGFIYKCSATERRYFRITAISQDDAIQEAKKVFKKDDLQDL